MYTSLPVMEKFFATHRYLLDLQYDYHAQNGGVLSDSKVNLLRTVFHHQGIGVNEIAKRLRIKKSSVSVMVDTLVSEGWLDKEQSIVDKRAVGISVTNYGV